MFAENDIPFLKLAYDLFLGMVSFVYRPTQYLEKIILYIYVQKCQPMYTNVT